MLKVVLVQKKIVTIHYNQRGYECASCGKSFNKNNYIVSIYSHHTLNSNDYIVNFLRSKVSINDISKEANVAPCFISKMLPYLSITCTKLPKVLCIDEFKENSGTEGINNKIKTLKRISFGMPNFTHFKARIMLLD